MGPSPPQRFDYEAAQPQWSHMSRRQCICGRVASPALQRTCRAATRAPGPASAPGTCGSARNSYRFRLYLLTLKARPKLTLSAQPCLNAQRANSDGEQGRPEENLACLVEIPRTSPLGALSAWLAAAASCNAFVCCICSEWKGAAPTMSTAACAHREGPGELERQLHTPTYSSQSIRSLARAVTGLSSTLLSLVLQLPEHRASPLIGTSSSS